MEGPPCKSLLWRPLGPFQAPAITNRPPAAPSGLSLKHLLTNSFSLSLDFLHFHVDNPRCCKLTDDAFDSFRLFCFDGNGATQREISGRPPHFFRRLSRNLADKLRQRSQTAQQPALPRPKRKSQNTSGLARNFLPENPFFWEAGGPERVRRVGQSVGVQ